jgi:hypothetical protein
MPAYLLGLKFVHLEAMVGFLVQGDGYHFSCIVSISVMIQKSFC